MNNPIDIIQDFNFKVARVFVSGNLAIIDNVKKIIIMSESNITVDFGKEQMSLYGSEFTIDYIYDGRIGVNGIFKGIEFFRG